jgi:hypothetical protein
MTLGINAFVVSATIFKYNESVVFSISRARGLRWQRSSLACPHRKERGERYGDYREERRAQCGEGHKESRAHCGLRVHAIVENVIRLSMR